MTLISRVDVTDPTITDGDSGLGSISHAFRAFSLLYADGAFRASREYLYWIVARVLGLTVPIVTEETTNDIAKSNPRATHEEW